MNILLINKNPVVSRLLSLVTRQETIILEEIHNIKERNRDEYDVIFVDESVYEGKVKNLDTYLKKGKKVLFTHSGITADIFDQIIEKPFLPAQILEVIESITDQKEDIENGSASTQVLDSNEVEKIKELLDMNDIEYKGSNEVLSDEEYETRKIKAIKEQLIAEGLEIVEEEEILEDLGVVKPTDNWEISNDKRFLDKVMSKKKSRKKKLAAKKDDLVVEAIEMAIRTLKKKQRKKLLKGKEVEITIQLAGKVK